MATAHAHHTPSQRTPLLSVNTSIDCLCSLVSRRSILTSVQNGLSPTLGEIGGLQYGTCTGPLHAKSPYAPIPPSVYIRLITELSSWAHALMRGPSDSIKGLNLHRRLHPGIFCRQPGIFSRHLCNCLSFHSCCGIHLRVCLLAGFCSCNCRRFRLFCVL